MNCSGAPVIREGGVTEKLKIMELWEKWFEIKDKENEWWAQGLLNLVGMHKTRKSGYFLHWYTINREGVCRLGRAT